ncbi:MAG TPA: hypothetical protein VJ957_06805, partial [Longimicrobiales bacterium]|nr:hypothetical protein [Longimicrobiales bacterium]
MSVDLFQPVLGGGIRDPYFFNGRLLSAEDMGALQKAEVQRLRRIGRVLGAGVAFGLDVRLNDTSTAEQPVLSVTPGVALDHRGEALELPEAVDVTLLRDEPASGTQGYFAVCPPPRPTATPTNPDLYLLAMTGSSGYEGSVPMTEVGSGGVATSCGRQYRVHGVSFRLLRMPLADDLPWPAEHISPIAQELETRFYQVAEGTVSDAAQSAIRHNVNRLRNALAYAFFQPGELTDFATRPFDGERAAATDAAPFEALW